MAKVRGFVYFEDRNLIQVKEAFWNFNIPRLNYKFFDGLIGVKGEGYSDVPEQFKFFKGLEGNKKKIELPGIFIDGELDVKNKKDYSKEIVGLLRSKVGLAEKIINCDVSSALGNEDYIMHLKEGDLKGEYVAIRLLPPYPRIGGIERVASELGNIINASDILVRGVEKMIYKDKEIDKRCIDLTGNINFDKKKKDIKGYLESKKIVLEGYTLIELL